MSDEAADDLNEVFANIRRASPNCTRGFAPMGVAFDDHAAGDRRESARAMRPSAETSASFRGADAEEIQRRKRSCSVPKVMSIDPIDLSKVCK
jgi:hypothetical protein